MLHKIQTSVSFFITIDETAIKDPNEPKPNKYMRTDSSEWFEKLGCDWAKLYDAPVIEWLEMQFSANKSGGAHSWAANWLKQTKPDEPIKPLIFQLEKEDGTKELCVIDKMGVSPVDESIFTEIIYPAK